jgi:hypothetical protein
MNNEIVKYGMNKRGCGKSGIGKHRRDSYREIYRERKEINRILPEGEAFNPKSKAFTLPENLNVSDIQALNLPDKFIPNILLLLALVNNITTFKRVVIKEENPFARINSVILSQFLLTLGPSSKKLIDLLCAEKWIEVDHSYKVGVQSKGYRIGEKFRDSKWIKQDWVATLELFVPAIKIKSIIARQKDVLYNLWNRAGVYFTTWQTMPEGDLKDICRRTEEIGSRIRVEYLPEIHQVIKNCAIEHIEEQRKKGKLNPNWTVEKQIQNYYKSLSLFDGNNFGSSSHDPTRFEFGTGRVFSNVVNLKSELRQFLRLDGQSFVNVDIQSCQVALLSTFYLPEDSAESEKFKSIICGQDIYLFLGGSSIPRAEAKNFMFRVMFDRNCNQEGPVCARFKEEFPILFQRIWQQKEEHGYCSVAFHMQKKEASIMIHKVLKSLFFEDNLDCVSIHDSIFCLPENAELVKNRIYSFFFAAMGFCPAIKIS